MSDGTTVFQTPDVDGEMTSWQKLRHRCIDDGDLHITQLQLQTGGETHTAIPNADGYVAFYEAKASYTNPHLPQKIYQGVGAVFGDFVFFTLTNHQGTWSSDVRPLASMLAHCQLKPAGARRRQDERPALPANAKSGLAVIDATEYGVDDYNTS